VDRISSVTQINDKFQRIQGKKLLQMFTVSGR